MRRFATAALVAGTITACGGVSTQQEVQLGTDYAAQINAELPIVQDPAIAQYVTLLGDSIARLADDRGLTWHFYVVDSPEVNAFAVPGGYIYINRGLIERAQTLSQVAGVLGHEIGHVTERHSIQQMEKSQQANLGLGLLCILTPSVCQNQATGAAIQLGAGALFASFSRKDELEADAEGIKSMVRAGIDPNGVPEMFEILMAERERSPGAVDAWFSTHPTEESRIAESRKMIQAIEPIILEGLTKDSQNFQAFRQRLRSLPPSPPPRRPPGQ
jgi:beta-barrel assembly-enhancing protease